MDETYLIGIDISAKDSLDMSCITFICKKCRHVVYRRLLDASKEYLLEIPQHCIYCEEEQEKLDEKTKNYVETVLKDGADLTCAEVEDIVVDFK